MYAFFRSGRGYDKDILKKARYEGLKAAIRLMPMGAVMVSVYAAAVFLLFGKHLENRLLMAGIGGTILTGLISLPISIWDIRRGCPDTRFLRIRHIAFNGLLSLCVALYMFETVQYTQGSAFVFSGIMIFAFTAAGGFALSTYPPSQIAWLLFMAACICGFILHYAPEIALSLIMMFLFYVGMIIFVSFHIMRLLYERIALHVQSENQSSMIRMLLSDFEEKASDWLVEIDAKGRVTHVSPRFAESIHRTTEELLGVVMVDFMSVIYVPQGGESYKERNLRIAREHAPIHNVIDEVIIDGQHRWWLTNAQPLCDAKGRYAGWRLVGRDITDHKMHEEKIEWQATHDIFTGLYHRNRFIELIGEAAAGPEAASCALVLVDIINFKTIRTIHGQTAGDRVILETAARLQAAFADSAKIARMGSSEFALLICNEDALKKLRNRLPASLTRPVVTSAGEVAVDLCAGIARMGKDASDTENLLQCADLALTAAKGEGPGKVCRYARILEERYLYRLTLIEDMDRALSRGEFFLHYQPIVSAITNRAVRAEALVRWAHPKKGVIPPGEFIPLAEQSGKITGIGAWVVRQACADAAAWPEGWSVSVNISAEQFIHGDLVREVREALNASGLPASRLTIEITESVLIESRAHILGTLQALRAMDVSIALDDFGAGFSSLGYLQTFPLNEIKIDRSFVQTITTGSEPVPIIETMIVLAKKLGLLTVAEGIETQAQAALLKSLGCDQFQGFLFSHPVPQADILERQRQ